MAQAHLTDLQVDEELLEQHRAQSVPSGRQVASQRNRKAALFKKRMLLKHDALLFEIAYFLNIINAFI